MYLCSDITAPFDGVTSYGVFLHNIDWTGYIAKVAPMVIIWTLNRYMTDTMLFTCDTFPSTTKSATIS